MPGVLLLFRCDFFSYYYVYSLKQGMALFTDFFLKIEKYKGIISLKYFIKDVVKGIKEFLIWHHINYAYYTTMMP